MAQRTQIMNEQEYIKEAVALADGWKLTGDAFVLPDGILISKYSTVAKDALAAQLKRQVNVTKTNFVVTAPLVTKVYESLSSISEQIVAEVRGGDCSDNDIKAIVESEVLKTN